MPSRISDFDGVRVDRAGELLVLRLAALDDGDRQPVFRGGAVALKADGNLVQRLLFGGVEGVSLLPQELGRPQEEARAQLPADHVVP